MATWVHRDLDGESRPLFVRDAAVGGLDLDWRPGPVGVLGHVAVSRLSGDPAAVDEIQRNGVHSLQRPDAPYLRYDPGARSLSGWGGELVGGKLDGAPWRFGWAARARSPGFDPNDLGYLQRADSQHVEAWIERRREDPGPFFKFFEVDSAVWFDKTFGAEITGAGASVNTWWKFPNEMYAYSGGLRRQQALDPSLLRGGPAFLMPGSWSGWHGLGTDPRRSAVLDLVLNWTLRDEGMLRAGDITSTVTLRPTSAVKLVFGPRLEGSVDKLQYVDTVGPDIVLGELHRVTASLVLRANWALSTKLTLETYAMPYVSAGNYESFSRVTEPRAERLAERTAPTTYDGDDRFRLAQIRSNVVLRWEWAPGSSAILAWSREQTSDRSDLGDIAWRRDSRQLLSAAASDVLMLKITRYDCF